MKAALAYRRGRDPLHRAGALPAICFLASFLVLVFVSGSPLILAAVGVAAAAVGFAAGARDSVWLAFRWGVSVAVLVTVVNALVVDEGHTVLLRLGHAPLLGQVNVTLEALTEGARLGLRLTVSFMLFAVYSACVDPDEVLRLLRPIARRSALTAGLVSRMVPLAVSDMSRLAEASRLRGPAAAPVGRGAMVRRVVSGSLDRSVDIAATLELRGYSLPAAPRESRPPLRRSRHDFLFFAVAGAVFFGGLAVLALGAGDFDAYARTGMEMDLDPATLGLAAALPAAAMVPFAWVAWEWRNG